MPDPQKLATILRQATTLFRATPGRTGRFTRLPAGVGLRIVVPMMGPVPIALDFGFPIVRGPDDREQIFSFWVGLFR